MQKPTPLNGKLRSTNSRRYGGSKWIPEFSRRLIEFLGLPWDDRCVDFHKSDRPVKTASVAQVRKPIYKTSVQRWKKYGEGLQPLVNAIDGKAEKEAPKPKGKAKVKENA